MSRRSANQLAYQSIRIEGGLIPADELARLTGLQTPDKTEQTENHYGIPKGLKLRDEVARYWKISQNLWADFQTQRQRTDLNTHDLTVREFLLPLLRNVLGFADLEEGARIEASGHAYNIGYLSGDGRVPLILAAHTHGLDASDDRFGEMNPETGKIRRRSPFMLAQEALNASDDALWAVVSNGLRLRILRDNPSLTRPVYVEINLEAIFTEELYADFVAFWLLAHASRFAGLASVQEAGAVKVSDPANCPWERWRNAGQEAGVRARDRLRDGVTVALRALGTGFLSHRDNNALRQALQQENGLSKQAFFEELLRLIYRLIFLATVEDRTDGATGLPLIFTPNSLKDTQQRYLAGYSLTWLRERAARRSGFDTHSDLWQALSITFDALGRGEPALALPALGGLFDTDQCAHLGTAQIENRWLLAAIFQLGYFREPTGLTRVNYRDMGPEELGSVYESLLELVPDLQNLSQPHAARLAFVGDDDAAASTRGNTRKLTGSYYTPDPLVQELIQSALEPVIADTLRANQQRPVEALLDLTICDPACGSGHFLLAAARRLADEVAKLRAPSGAPSQADYRHALRDVVSHCIFGVDKNPMAIALAKTALWLEAYTPDRPLSFLDHHLQVGDALLGVLDPKVLENGIPSAAYTVLSGDDKEVVKTIRKNNQEALKSIASMKEKSRHMLNLGFEEKLDSEILESLPDDTLEALEAKRAAYQEMEAIIAASKARLSADLFVAAFVLSKTPDNKRRIPTSQDLWLVLNGSAPRQGVAETATEAARAAQAFHWWQVFPQVKAKGGFDVLLGNPPWERIKLQEEEFFAARSPLVAMARNKAVRSQRIEWLREGVLLHNLFPDVEAAEGLTPPNGAEMRLYQEFISARRSAEAASLYAHDSGRYPLTGVGDVNTYALFAETFTQITAAGGRAGFIVPSGLATDNTTKDFFGELISNQALVSFFEFENEGFFPSAGQGHMLRFALTTVVGAEKRVGEMRFLFQGKKISDLVDKERVFTLSPSDIFEVNPNTKTCPIFCTRKDADLTKKIYSHIPVLVREKGDGAPEKNPWGIRFMAMFHMANDSHLFKTKAELVSGGFVQEGNHFVQGINRFLPLYEAKMIQQYNHRYADFADSQGERAHSLPSIPEERLNNPHYLVEPYYWVPESEIVSRVGSDKFYFAFRSINNSANARAFVGTVIPAAGVGHSAVVIKTNNPSRTEALLWGLLSSLVFEYLIRQKLGGTNISLFILRQLPVLPPDAFSGLDIDFIVPRVLELTYTAHDLKPWADDLAAYDPRPAIQRATPFAWSPERRAQLRAELDAYYARLYDLTRDELRYILDPSDVMGDEYPSETFRVLKNNEMREFGEYRTQRLVLEAWDRLESGELVPAVLPDHGTSVVYSELGVIQNESEAKLAGLVAALVAQRGVGISITELQEMVASATRIGYPELLLESKQAERLQSLVESMTVLTSPEALALIPQFVERLEASGSVRRERKGETNLFRPGGNPLPADVRMSPVQTELADLMLALDAQRRRAQSADMSSNEQGERDSGVG